MIAIIDYDAGNIKSVEKALLALGEKAVVTRERNTILAADKVILPGVGAFGESMEKLRSYRLDEVIREVVQKQTPFLGVCLGLQLLFERSEESNGVSGLSLLKGIIKKIPNKQDIKIPHIGWNSLHFPKSSILFQGLEQESYVYFVHSYYMQAEEDIVTATTEYGICLPVAVEKGNIFACQFHPEKSSDVGLTILKNFVAIGKEVQ